MKRKAIAGALMFFSFTGVVSAHRLDEYLQATLIAVEKDRVEVSLRLIPGVAVSSAVIASIDTNGDGLPEDGEPAFDYHIYMNHVMDCEGWRFFQSSYDPDLPPLRPTADLPRAAAALEMRAAFSLESPCLRRSSYIFSFLIDELGMAAILRLAR